MQDDLSLQLHQRLSHLRESVKRDSDAMQASGHRFPGAQPIFDQLFDAIESTLQNVDEMSVDGSGN